MRAFKVRPEFTSFRITQYESILLLNSLDIRYNYIDPYQSMTAPSKIYGLTHT